MASSNRHWPSMFKSKPNHQWQHDMNINSSLISSSSGCHRYSSGQGLEEQRTPEPKPRWNPRPEQIRILESIFNSGIINPPREEIRRIRAQLQEYGQVGDANVFYWFQNRKSRTKLKLRQHQIQTTTTNKSPPPPAAAAYPPPISSSSSSSTDKSSPSPNSSNLSAVINSPTASVNQQPFAASGGEYLPENYFFPAQQSPGLGQGFSFSGGGAAAEEQSRQNFLLSELMLMSNCPSKKKMTEDDDDLKMKLAEQHLSYAATAVSDPAPPPSINQFLQGLGECGGPTARTSTMMTVFINDVCFEVGVGPFNVREAFGDDVVMMQSTGQPVLTNGWGVTLHPLQHGAFYYLMRPFTHSLAW